LLEIFFARGLQTRAVLWRATIASARLSWAYITFTSERLFVTGCVNNE